MANPEHLAKLKEGVEAWHEWRDKNPRTRPDLSLADLRDADLSGANLSEAELSGTSGGTDIEWDGVGGADLRGANLVGADLNAADLGGADLREANLLGADLSAARLSLAYLYGTNLTAASVAGTEFTAALVQWTQWGGLDLSEAAGLESIRHVGPSSVGIDTLVKSKGRIPDVFLRGCGLADWEIENAKLYAPDLSEAEITDIQYRVHGLRVASSIRFYSVFISYSHEDKAFARALHDALQASGIRCWLDEKQLLPGDDIHEQIDRGIRHWDKVILCASRASLTSWWVDKELTTAFAKEAQIMKERGKKVLALVPLNLDGFLFQWENGKATEVRARFAPDFTAWQSEGFDLLKAIEPLIKALKADDGGREPAPTPRL